MNIDNWQNQINDIENYKTQGTIIRSKKMTIINVINEETPNKYSYLQEQQKQAKKNIKQLQNEKNKIIKTNSEILKECSLFYQTLYSQQQNCEEAQNEILNNLLNLMKNEQNEQLTKLINKNELNEAIYPMKNDKSPGIDSVTINFTKIFMTP